MCAIIPLDFSADFRNHLMNIHKNYGSFDPSCIPALIRLKRRSRLLVPNLGAFHDVLENTSSCR
jgi:hypothetical protein